ncbi:MAG TPA: YhbY family RNA-binding protein [Gemmatimonadaceae bacterium]|nr:YhbY family RNA-binding protein [Gemmatimonadaceae bacterium]
MTMRGKDRAALRAEANGLAATVHVGHAGLVPGVIGSLDDALRTRELVKVQLSKREDRKPKEMARELADATASEVIQVIGRTVTLYRHNPELHKDG